MLPNSTIFKPIRLAIIGLGHQGLKYVEALRYIPSSIFQLISVCDINAVQLDNFKTTYGSVSKVYQDYATMMDNEDINALVLAIPHNIYYEVMSYILKYDEVYILKEKPFACNLQESAKHYPRNQLNDDALNILNIIINMNTKNIFSSLLAEAYSCGVKKIVVGAVIGNYQGKILLLKRSEQEKFLPGIIELPSGHIEAGEDIIQALTREVMEETGMQIDRNSISYLSFFDYLSKSNKPVRQLNFTVNAVDTQDVKLSSLEHQAYFWCDFSEAKLLGADNTVLNIYKACAEKSTGTILKV